MSDKPGLGGFNPFDVGGGAGGSSSETGRGKRKPKGPTPRRTLHVPVELGELLANAAAYHGLKVRTLTESLIREGLERMEGEEAQRLGDEDFAYPQRPMPR